MPPSFCRAASPGASFGGKANEYERGVHGLSPVWLGVQRGDLVRIDAVFGDGLGHLPGGHCPAAQRPERSHHDVMAVDLECSRSFCCGSRGSRCPAPLGLARRDERADLVGVALSCVVGRTRFQRRAVLGLRARVQQVPARPTSALRAQSVLKLGQLHTFGLMPHLSSQAAPAQQGSDARWLPEPSSCTRLSPSAPVCLHTGTCPG